MKTRPIFVLKLWHTECWSGQGVVLLLKLLIIYVQNILFCSQCGSQAYRLSTRFSYHEMNWLKFSLIKCKLRAKRAGQLSHFHAVCQVNKSNIWNFSPANNSSLLIRLCDTRTSLLKLSSSRSLPSLQHFPYTFINHISPCLLKIVKYSRGNLTGS